MAAVVLLSLFVVGAIALARPFRQQRDAAHAAAIQVRELDSDLGLDSSTDPGANPGADSAAEPGVNLDPAPTTHNPDSNSGPDQDDVSSALERVAAMSHEELDRRIASLGLTPRERECATLVLAGLSQHEVAIRCGVKDSTVRATLHHAYKKVGVSNVQELAELVATPADEAPRAEAEAGAEAETTPEAARPTQESHVLRLAAQAQSAIFTLTESLQSVGLFTLTAATLFPMLSESEGWGYGFETVMGVSAGVLLFVAVGICAQVLAPLNSKAPDAPRSKLLRRACQLADIALTCAAGFLCICRVDPMSGLAATAFQLMPAIMCSYALLSYVVLQSLCRGLQRRRLSCTLEAAGSLVIVDILARAGLGLSAAYAGLMLYGFSSLARVGLGASRQKPVTFQPEKETPLHLTLLKIALGAFLGFAFEELWRDVGAESYVLALAPLCLPLAGVSIAAIARHRGHVGPWIAGSVAWLIAFTVLGEGYTGLLTLGIALAAYSLALSSERPFHPALLASFGAFATANIIAVSIVQDWAMWEPLWVLQWFSSGWTFSVASVVFACSVCVLASACHWLLCREYEYRRAEEHYRNSERGAKERPERLRALLGTYGLSDIQGEIMLMTAAGSTAREIAEHLHYTVSTIKGQRTKSYKLLSVKSRAELLDLLSQLDAM